MYACGHVAPPLEPSNDQCTHAATLLLCWSPATINVRIRPRCLSFALPGKLLPGTWPVRSREHGPSPPPTPVASVATGEGAKPRCSSWRATHKLEQQGMAGEETGRIRLHVLTGFPPPLPQQLGCDSRQGIHTGGRPTLRCQGQPCHPWLGRFLVGLRGTETRQGGRSTSPLPTRAIHRPRPPCRGAQRPLASLVHALGPPAPCACCQSPE